MMHQPSGARSSDGGGGSGSGSGSGSAPLQTRLTALADIMEDSIVYVCCFLLLEEVGRLDMAICSASLRCAFLRSISGDALAALKTEIYSYPPSELGRWLSLRGMALREYTIVEGIEGAPLDIFRNTKRLVFHPSILDHPLVGVLLAQTRHTLEELCVDDDDCEAMAVALLPLLETLRCLDMKISAIKINCDVDADFSEVARYLATHFTNLRHLHFPRPCVECPHLDADVEVILRACSNLESFHLPRMGFESGHLFLDEVSTHSLALLAFQRFAEMVTTLTWELTDTNDDDLVLMTSMCNKLQTLELKKATNVTDEGIIRALPSLPHLTFIELYLCSKLTVAGLKAPLERCKLLQDFGVYHDISVDGSSQKCSYCLTYECGELHIQYDSVRSYSLLRAALERFGASITSLDCTWPEVGDDGLSLMTSMCGTLQRLKLESATNVTDEGIIRALSPPLVPHLTSIELCKCSKLTVAGLQALIESRWPLRYFSVGRDVNKDWYKILPRHLYFNALTFDEGAIKGNGDLYWPLVEVFSCRQRDTLKAIGDRLPP
jgi:hypothetical protein